jgi:nucleoside permease NupC
MTRLPAWTQPVLFALLTTGFASSMVAGIATYRAIGLPPDFLMRWAAAWLWSWPVAFPARYVIAPHVRRLLARICSSA